MSLCWVSCFHCNAECRYAGCHVFYCNAECCHAEFHYVELCSNKGRAFAVMLNVVMLGAMFLL
jgi:hypothetical protein